MGIAAMVIGIVAALLSFIPFCGMLAFIPAVVGLILGIVDVVLKGKKNQPKGMGIAGIALNAVALAIMLIYTLLFGAGTAAASEELQNQLNQANIQYQSSGQWNNVPASPAPPVQPTQPTPVTPGNPQPVPVTPQPTPATPQ